MKIISLELVFRSVLIHIMFTVLKKKEIVSVRTERMSCPTFSNKTLTSLLFTLTS